MLIEEIDGVLGIWKRDLSSIENNLLELNNLISYQILSAGHTRFTGKSATEVPQALAAVEQLWEQLRLVQEVVQKATELRSNLPFIKRAQVLAEIEQMLTGPSVVLPAREVPLAQRGLLSESESLSRLSPEQAKRLMVRLFETARSVFVTIDNRWSEAQGQLDAQRQRAIELSEQVKRLRPGEVREVVRLLSVLDTLEAQTRTDPLGFSSPEEFLRPFFKEARGMLAELQHEHGLRSQRRDELALHRERALKLAARVKVLGEANSPEVERLLGVIAEFERRLPGEPSLIGVNLDELLRTPFRQAREAVQALEASRASADEQLTQLTQLRGKAQALAEKMQSLGAPMLSAERLLGRLEELATQPTRVRLEGLEEYLRPYFSQARQAIAKAEEEARAVEAMRCVLAKHRERLNALQVRAKAQGEPVPALDKLRDTFSSLEAEFERAPGRFSDPGEYLEPFFTKATSALDSVVPAGDKLRAALARARTQGERLTSLYAEAQGILAAARRMGLSIALPELPPAPSSMQALTHAEAAYAEARWDAARQALDVISAEYGQSVGVLRALITGGAPVVALMELEQKLQASRSLIAKHNLQNDKPSRAYLAKLEALLSTEAPLANEPPTLSSLVDNVARLVYSLETRLGELILSSH